MIGLVRLRRMVFFRCLVVSCADAVCCKPERIITNKIIFLINKWFLIFVSFHKRLNKPGKIKKRKDMLKNFQGSVCNVSKVKIKNYDNTHCTDIFILLLKIQHHKKPFQLPGNTCRQANLYPGNKLNYNLSRDSFHLLIQYKFSAHHQ